MLLFLLVFLIPTPSLAAESPESCKTTWNLPDFLEKPRDQADIGWCYAYAAADLASAYQGEVVSAADLAILKNESAIRQTFISSKKLGFTPRRKTELREGGSADQALFASIDVGGFCSESDLPSNVVTRITDDPKSKSTKFAQFTLADRLYAALRLGRLNQSPIDCETSPEGAAALGFPNVPTKEITEILGKLNDLDGDRDRSYRLAAVAAANCDSRRTPAKFSEKDVQTKRLTADELDQVLASGRLAAVGVPTVPILKKPSEALLKQYAHDRKGLERSEDGHMMLLVGQKWNAQENRCEYIFKNSWGDTSRPSKNRKMVNGYMFIPREKIAEVETGEMTTITKTPTWKAADLPDYFR